MQTPPMTSGRAVRQIPIGRPIGGTLPGASGGESTLQKVRYHRVTLLDVVVRLVDAVEELVVAA